MRVATILLALVMVLAAVSVSMADGKDKPEGVPTDFTRGLLNCTNAIPINCGSVVQGSNAGIASLVTTYSCSTWPEGGGEVVYTLVLPGPNNYNITATLSAVTQDPDIFLLSACDEATCIAYGDASLTKNGLAPGTYYIVVDQYGSAPATPASWTLTIACTEVVPPCCPFPQVCYSLDFNQSPNGWTSLACGTGPIPWQWGVAAGIPTTACDAVPVTNVLVTNLAGNYPLSVGEAAVVGPFYLYSGCRCLELCHYYYFESTYDGGNVRISTDGGVTWTRITPSAGYPGTISTSFSCQCVLGEPAFTGNSSTFIRTCFDISQYVGQTVLIGFFAGSDTSVSYRGWAIKWLKIGGSEVSPVESKSWGNIKSMYR
jgi:hypothetical protein